MTSIAEIELSPKGGAAFQMRAGHSLRITARSGVSLVAFNAADLGERFDQARTKVYNMKLWLDVGDKLFSKLNNPMMVVIEDGFRPYGRHDLQLGLCSSEGEGGRTACLESLVEALAPWNIPAHSIPMSLNAFQNCNVNVASGEIAPAPVHPQPLVTLVLRAEMDLVAAVAVCQSLVAANAPPVLLAVTEG